MIYAYTITMEANTGEFIDADKIPQLTDYSNPYELLAFYESRLGQPTDTLVVDNHIVGWEFTHFERDGCFYQLTMVTLYDRIPSTSDFWAYDYKYWRVCNV